MKRQRDDTSQALYCKRRALPTVSDVFPWYDLPPELREMALATLDFVTRATFAGVNNAERYWLWVTDPQTNNAYLRPCPLDYYEQIAALVTLDCSTNAFRYHWLRCAPINRLQLWLCLRPHRFAHDLLSLLQPMQVTVCWSACIARPPFEDDKDLDMAPFCQETALRLLRLWPLSPDLYTDILHGTQHGMEIEGLAIPREWHSPAAILFTQAVRQRERHPLSISVSHDEEEEEDELVDISGASGSENEDWEHGE
jgi:hypothetical protein